MLKLQFYTVGLVFAALLSACSSDSGQQAGNSNPAPIVDADDEAQPPAYSGPTALKADISDFKIEFWNNIAQDNRCGACHVQADQSPQFARSDDINLAYAATDGIVNLSDPASSLIVTKVASGHNCWSSDNKFCEEKLISWITKWASNSGVEITQAALRAPEVFEVSASLVFPESVSNFETMVYTPILQRYCADCHRGDAPQAPVQPYFSSSNSSVAYEAAQTKMFFDATTNEDGTVITSIDASRSRLVERLREEAHNCWNNDCVASAAAMEAALESFAATMDFVGLDDSLITSKAMLLGSGTAISQGGRTETNAIAIYPFKAGSGPTAENYADVLEAEKLNLTLNDEVEWVSNWGVRIDGGSVSASVSGSRSLYKKMTETGEYSIEAWVIPANVTQEDAFIVSYSGGESGRNFTMGQTLYNYDFHNRSSVTNANGGPRLSTPDAAEVLQATLQHVVMSYDGIEGRKIYVNGELIVNEDPEGGGALSEWDETFALFIGNETKTGNYPWKGTVRFLALHNRVLTPEQIKGNYDVGVGLKILVAFSIGHLIDDMTDAYIVFQVEQFDDYSYLFNNPYFFSFTETPPSDIDIKGLRIGINGREASIGQAYANLDLTISSADYDPEGVPLSSLGTVIALEKGPAQDQFFLGFDSIEGNVTGRPEESLPAPPSAEFLEESQPRIAVRTFAEINASLSAMTGVPVTHSDVATTFSGLDGLGGVQQQMPSDENISGFLVAHQMGITQLAVKYCNVLATEDSRMATFFPNFTGNNFNSAGRSALIDPLLKTLLAHDIASEAAQLDNQPDVVDSSMRLNELMDVMTSACGGGICSDTVTDNTVTSVCAAALGSAVMLIQ